LIDFNDLERLCAGLPAQTAGALAHRAAVALDRRHMPGVGLRVIVALDSEHELRWTPRSAGVAINEDSKDATSEGAMGIALAVANRDHRWRLVRRLQSTVGEGADWLMKNEAGASFILEVKGTDEASPSPGSDGRQTDEAPASCVRQRRPDWRAMDPLGALSAQ